MDAPGSQRPVKRRPLPSDPFRGPASAPATPDHMQTPPRPQPNPPTAFIPKQSPLQAVEYGTPPPQARHFQPQQQDHYSPGPQNDTYATPPLRMSNSAPQHHRSVEGHDTYPLHPDDMRYSPDYRGLPERPDPRAQYGQPPDQFDRSPRDDPHWAPPDEDRPPPPPAHRSRNNSGNTQDMAYRGGYEAPPQHATPPTMRKDVLRNEAHRNSVPAAYPGRPVYRAYDTAPSPPSNSPYGNSDPHQPSPPRHHSYDSSYDSHYRAMQPTVEDAPESPSPSVQDQFRRSGSRMPQYDEPDYNQVPSPAPLNLSGRHSASAGSYGAGAMVSHRHHGSHDYEPSEQSVVSRNSNPSSSQVSYHSHSAPPAQNYPSYRSELDDTQVTGPAKYNLPALPPVPPSLVPGVDPALSMEVAHRINEDRRQDRRYPQPLVTPTRGRQMSDMSPNYPGHGGSPQQFSTPQQSYDRSPISYSGGPSPQIIKPRAISPSPSPTAQHTIRRKSISPAPPTDGRRLSGIPFGPDSYDALNPTLASSAPKEVSRPDYNETNGKIITHDGKEVDPSDHLPMETWAPEPEPKGKKPAPTTSSRPSPSGAQPMPPAGRRPLRIANRPQSSAVLPPPAQYISAEIPEPSPPPPTGRNRLQKKANRASVPVMSGANGGSSPLAPLPQHQDNFTPPRQLPRASTFDYPNENHAPMYGSSPGARSHSSISAPPVPAKIPISKSGGLPMLPSSGGRGPGGDGDWALMEEMSRIDIGTGRARRHGHRGY